MPKVQVVYIAGTMRSGSTLLGRLLGELPEAVHVGELGLFSSTPFHAGARCECRALVQDCAFWQAVFEAAFGKLSAGDLAAFQATRSLYRLRSLPRLLLPRTAAQTQRLGEYLEMLGALYTAVQEVSGASVIVDGSKDPLYAFLLRQVPLIDLHGVHLVRDSRAVAFSQQRVKKDPTPFSNPCQLAQFLPWQTALQWNTVTALLDAAPGLLPLRYEDFVADPADAVRRVWRSTGLPLPPLEFLRQIPLPLARGHSAAGNPDRFRSEVHIQPDLEWQKAMKPADKRLVTALTFPLLLRHGYLPLPFRRPSPDIHPARVL